MSGNFWLDWALLTLSLFNVVIMLWLGLMILFSAERRSWGVFLSSGGLLAGTVFFISHAALLGQNIAKFSTGVNFWWHIGWAPIIAAPFAWYIVMLWFSGYWQQRQSVIRRRHQPWLVVVIIYGVLLGLLLLIANPMGNLTRSTIISYDREYISSGIPAMYFAYPVFILLCITLSMDALLRPGPTHRVVGRSAREKARPWLVASSFTLLVTCGIVGYTIGWVLDHARTAVTLPELYGNIAPSLAWFDLILSLLVTSAVLLIGQAIVSYEVFTGKPLPRRGFRRQWLSAMAMAAVLASTTAWVFQKDVKPIHLLLFAIALVTVFFALFSWRYSEEREQFIHQLRPFVGSQNLASAILSDVSRTDLQQQFVRIAVDVLNLRMAALLPYGRLADLEIVGLTYPEMQPEEVDNLCSLVAAETSWGSEARYLDRENGTIWLVPLWSKRGMDGVFILGGKADDGFLSMEEVDIARSSGEQLLDLMLTAELARRLVQLQRERFTEQALLDQMPRRIIHDEVLPQVHASVLELSGKGAEAVPSVQEKLGSVHRQLSALLREMPSTRPGGWEDRSLAAALQEMLNREFRQSFHTVTWEVQPEFEGRAEMLSGLVREVIFFAAREAIRNAAKYARTAANDPVDLIVRCRAANSISLEIEDNGQGLPFDAGRSRGHGLDLHSLMMTIVGGRLALESTPGTFTRVRLEI